MNDRSPAVADTNWLDEAGQLYLRAGAEVEADRPVYQGDVFADVPILTLPNSPPTDDSITVDVTTGPVMVVPHPCQCYYGDNLRKRLTVAPVTAVQNYDNFGADREGAKDKFALLDLPLPSPDGNGWTVQSCVADFGRLFTAPSRWLKLPTRVACLTHEGIGLLAKRLLGFQLRYPTTLANAMTYTYAEWHESFLMQAWVRRHGKLKGYTAWMHEPKPIPGVGEEGELIKPYDVRTSAPDTLLAMITGDAVLEPG